MMRKLKGLLIGVLGLLAIGAVAAPGAWATTHIFHGETEPVVVTAAQEPGTPFIFNIGELAIKCAQVRILGTAFEKSKEFSARTEVAECVFVGSIAVTVKTLGCTNITSGETDEKGHAQVELQCEAGKVIEVIAPTCTIKVPPQVFGGGVHFTNLGAGSKREVTLAATESGISYTTTGFGCTLIGLPKSGNNGALVGALIAKGYEDLGKEFPQNPPYEEGPQVGVWFE